MFVVGMERQQSRMGA